MKLYIIHGWTYTVEPWTKTIEALKKYHINVEMLHVPGLTTDSRKVWTIDDYVKWADNNIPDGATALGHSNGGRILLNLCAQNPDKLEHLILLDAAGVYEKSTKRDLLRKISKAAAPLKKIPGLRKAFHKLTRSTDYAKAPENMKKTLSNMLDSDKKLKFGQVATPVSILWGKADNVTPPHQAEIMHDELPHSTLKFYDGWTHAPYISHPSELARAIAQALKAAKDDAEKTAKASASSNSDALVTKAAKEVK